MEVSLNREAGSVREATAGADRLQALGPAAIARELALAPIAAHRGRRITDAFSAAPSCMITARNWRPAFDVAGTCTTIRRILVVGDQEDLSVSRRRISLEPARK